MAYMKNFIFILFLLFAANYMLLSDDYTDSLENELALNNNDEIKQIEVLLRLSKSYAINNPDSADYFINMLRKLAKSNNHTEGILSAEISASIKEAYLGNLSESNEILFRAESLAEKFNETESLNDIFLTIGINHLRMASYDEAIDYLNKSLEFARTNNLNDYLGRTLITLGIFFNKQRDYKKEKEYLLKALKLFQKENKKSSLSNVYSNLGTNFLKTGMPDSARYYFIKSLELDSITNDIQGVAITYHNLAATFETEDNLDSAIYYLNKSLIMKEKLNNQIGIANTKFSLAEVYFRMKQYNKAMNLAYESIEIYKAGNSKRKLLISYELLDTINEIRNDYANAYKYAKLAKKMQDSIYNERKQKIISDFESKYKLAEKEIENERLRRKSEKQEFTIIIVLLVIMIVVVLIIILYLRHRALEKINKLLNEKNDKIEKQNEELEELNSELIESNQELKELNATKDKFFSIISHDLKGPISSSYQLIDSVRKHYKLFTEEEKKENFDLLYDSTYNTYLLLENLLTWSRTQRDKIEYKPEVTNVKSITDITISHLLVFSVQKNITINNNIDENIAGKFDINMISTVLRNIINNAIKFTEEYGEINVDCKKENGNLKFSIADNGIGMDEKTGNALFQIDKTHSRQGTNNEKGTGLGLIIAWEFIKKHDGVIWAESKPGKGTTFYFTIPENEL